jgi:hypothetical protein
MDAAALVSGWSAAAAQPPALRAASLLYALDPRSTDVSRRPVGQVDAALLALRRRLLGDVLVVRAACERCDEVLEASLSVPALLSVEPASRVECTETYDDGTTVTARAVTAEDVAAGAACADAAAAVDRVVERCVRARRDGRDVAVRDCAPVVRADLERVLASLDPQGDVTLDVRCAACGRAWTPALDVGAVVWRELAACVEGLLFDVHRLASAYGWRHDDVLALPAPVRAVYLELVP